MDFTLILIAGFFIILGVLGSLIPIIPGPISGWLGLLILSFSSFVKIENYFLILSFLIALLIFFLDNITPILIAKKFGGGKGSTIGSLLGLVFGIIYLGPFGVLIGPFFGAFFGELIANFENKKGALKSAFGSFIGFLTGVLLKLIIGLIFLFYYIQKLLEFKNSIF